MQESEYKIIEEYYGYSDMDRLGREGWELVSVVPFEETTSYGSNQTPVVFGNRIESYYSELKIPKSEYKLKLFFKRPKVSQPNPETRIEIKEPKTRSKK